VLNGEMEFCSENKELFQQNRLVIGWVQLWIMLNIISKEAMTFPPRRAELEYNSKPFESKDEAPPPSSPASPAFHAP
jgi:hypothetical protein